MESFFGRCRSVDPGHDVRHLSRVVVEQAVRRLASGATGSHSRQHSHRPSRQDSSGHAVGVYCVGTAMQTCASSTFFCLSPGRTGHPASVDSWQWPTTVRGVDGARLPRVRKLHASHGRQLDHAEWRRVCASVRVAGSRPSFAVERRPRFADVHSFNRSFL